MNQLDDAEDDLVCLHDNTAVARDTPKCLHPSSFCDHRTLCPILEAQRKQRRAKEKEGADPME